MTIGIGGTGPYGKIRSLREEIGNYRYGIYLIENGLTRGSVAACKKKMAACREEIRTINASLKKLKK